MAYFKMSRVSKDDMDALRRTPVSRDIRAYPIAYSLDDETGAMQLWPVPPVDKLDFYFRFNSDD